MTYRISVDTGGTFTDVVLADDRGELRIGKALTTIERGFDSIRTALEQLAPELGLDVATLLERTSHFAYGTTRSTNAIVEGKTARTAFLTTAGFPDTLLLREGGKLGPFTAQEFNPPYVPRYLTFEVPERIDSDGSVHRPLDEDAVLRIVDACREQGVEAIGVALLWSTVNPGHELRIAELLAEHLPDVPVTVSHLLNPVVREYRRASSTVIDASLKPLMQRFLTELEDDLRAAGFGGNLLVSTSFGGSWPTVEMRERPIYSIGSGPSMAPIAGRACGGKDLDGPADLLICDTGGTTFDVSLVSSGEIHYTADTWIGGRWTGHITGTKAVDVRSIGAGGGSIVTVDSGGLVQVGPQSAGADPGPACYGRGGTAPTVTDAAALLGFLDPGRFLGGRLTLDVDAARRAFAPVAERLGHSVEEVARGALVIATQNVVSAIREITIAQGIDPRELTIVAGGGASGLNVVQIARELGCARVLLPRTAGALSATGALQADVINEFPVSRFADTARFDLEAVNGALAEAGTRADAFAAKLGEIGGLGADRVVRTATVDARYPGQVWELVTPLPGLQLEADDVPEIERRFHALHERVFHVSEPGQSVEGLTWTVRATAPADAGTLRVAAADAGASPETVERPVTFVQAGTHPTPIVDGALLVPGDRIAGPAIVVEPTTTLVLDPGAEAVVADSGTYVITVNASEADRPLVTTAKESVR